MGDLKCGSKGGRYSFSTTEKYFINFCPPFNLERFDNFSKHFVRKASQLKYRFNALSIDRGGTHPKC